MHTSAVRNGMREAAQMATRSLWFSRAPTAVTILSSVVALGFSGYSFYETVLKQPELRFYPPPQVYMYHQDDIGLDVFAVPVTISNDGARRGTVLSFDLEVTHRETGKTMKFKNLAFGDTPKDARLATPMTIAGRSSSTEVVLFYANALGTLDEGPRFVPGVVPGVSHPVRLPLRFALKMNVDSTGDWIAPRQPAPVVFEMTANARHGTPTRLYEARWADEAWKPPPENVDDRKAVQAYQESIFPAQQAALHKAAGFEVPIDVRWDAIALPDWGEEYSNENFWTKIFFVPLAQALSEVTSNSAGKQAVRDRLKNIIVTFDEATAPVSRYENGVTFEDGVLTLNFKPFSNATDITDRARAIRKKLEAKF
jgi:hypothetical protein